MPADETMRAWRTHEYGPRPTEVLQLDTVPIPEPDPGEVRVRVQAIPLNLNDLERINGGNMMVRPELPYSPGMEVMGIVDACGEGAEALAGQARRRDDEEARTADSRSTRSAPRSSTFEMPDVDPACPAPPRSTSRSTSRGSGCSTAPTCRPASRVLIHAAAGGSGSAAIQLAAHAGARVFATAGTDEKVQLCRELGADVAINYNDDRLRRGRARRRRTNRGVDVVFDNVGEAVIERSMNCTAYNGRYLMMGFASNKVVADEPFVVPAPPRAREPQALRRPARLRRARRWPMLKTAMGWNFVSERARRARSCARSSTLVRAGRGQARVGAGRRVRRASRGDRGDGEPPATGRTIVMVP